MSKGAQTLSNKVFILSAVDRSMLYAVGPRLGNLLEPVADECFRLFFTSQVTLRVNS